MKSRKPIAFSVIPIIAMLAVAVTVINFATDIFEGTPFYYIILGLLVLAGTAAYILGKLQIDKRRKALQSSQSCVQIEAKVPVSKKSYLLSIGLTVGFLALFALILLLIIRLLDYLL